MLLFCLKYYTSEWRIIIIILISKKGIHFADRVPSFQNLKPVLILLIILILPAEHK